MVDSKMKHDSSTTDYYQRDDKNDALAPAELSGRHDGTDSLTLDGEAENEGGLSRLSSGRRTGRLCIKSLPHRQTREYAKTIRSPLAIALDTYEKTTTARNYKQVRKSVKFPISLTFERNLDYFPSLDNFFL
jgi:hypothetical protein